MTEVPIPTIINSWAIESIRPRRAVAPCNAFSQCGPWVFTSDIVYNRRIAFIVISKGEIESQYTSTERDALRLELGVQFEEFTNYKGPKTVSEKGHLCIWVTAFNM